MPSLRKLIKRGANQLGLDVVRLHNQPRNTILGLKHLPIRTILDVGANRGQFAKYARQIFPQAHLYCFEPLLEPFEALTAWAESQGRVTAINSALGDREDSVEMFEHIDHDTSSSILASTSFSHSLYPFTANQRLREVHLTTLDRAIDFAEPLQPDILIKLDVQGYESRVLKGAARTLERATACLLEVSIDHLYHDQASFRDLFFLLDGFGYHYAGNLDQNYANDGSVLFLDALFRK